MKITILWSSLASYSVAFFRELVQKRDVKIQLVFQPVSKEAPYNQFDLSFCHSSIDASSLDGAGKLNALVRDFSPQCILMSSWNFHDYMHVARRMRKEGVYVVSSMDHQWEGRLKQYLGVVVSRWFLKPCIDTFLVAGDRQAEFARRLGYDDVLYGLYAAEISQFSNELPVIDREANFLFIGRLVPVKGIDLLIEGYRRYRELCSKPWGLKIVGTGNAELEQLVKNEDGIDHAGFVQPERLSQMMQQARCFVLPSRWEPWGVVLHEAAASGLPIIATSNCGAVTMFVRDGVNGCVIPPTTDAIAFAMLRISGGTDDKLAEMGKISHALAHQWSPKRQAGYFHDRVMEKIGG